MKVAYIFSTSGHTASYKLGRMILPQLEQGTHGVEVVGMFFFDDEQLSNVVDERVKDHQAATLSSVVVVSSSVTFTPSLKLAPSSTSAISSWPLKRRQRSCAEVSSL